MPQLDEIVAYVRRFQAQATQLKLPEYAEQWLDMGVIASEAAEWANAGYTPAEARAIMGERNRFPWAKHDDHVVARAEGLDDDDVSVGARFLRETAQSVQEHRRQVRRRGY